MPKPMLDKVLVVSKHQAYLIFTHREPVGVYSDKDVLVLLMILLDIPYAGYLEDTVKIEREEVA